MEVMKITHKKVWEPVVITLETKSEVRVLSNIIGDLTDSDIKRICKADKELLSDCDMSCSMTDVLYARLCESLE
jgi:hypothetical protein